MRAQSTVIKPRRRPETGDDEPQPACACGVPGLGKQVACRDAEARRQPPPAAGPIIEVPGFRGVGVYDAAAAVALCVCRCSCHWTGHA